MIQDLSGLPERPQPTSILTPASEEIERGAEQPEADGLRRTRRPLILVEGSR